ncbi:MAG: PAS domain-containing methyl-accepting chemotaxis protein [Opitutales bacterium]|nr:PAS domain-containing methyl-accepting chemotaxis protein [Opitutales bacterium]
MNKQSLEEPTSSTASTASTAKQNTRKTAAKTDQQAAERKKLEGQMRAIDNSMAYIEFDAQGIIQTANRNFLKTLKYELDEIVDKHHRIFCDETYRQSKEYEMFWEELRAGKTQTGEFRRFAKDGSAVWIQASYSPIMGDKGEVTGVIKIASDITESKNQNDRVKSQMLAIDNSMAYIEFDAQGVIKDANKNFLGAVKYELDEIVGKHHRIFCDEVYRQSREYEQFWEELRAGKTQTNEFQRIAKDGSIIWIQASYSPVTDDTGTVKGVIKIATDITEVKVESINKQRQLEENYRNQAVIEFDQNGICQDANENFCRAMGYSLNEIKGQHHRMFVEESYSNSHEYEQFWRNLRDGKFQTAEFKRFGKGGREVWIQATYNPMFDVNGNVCKVIKFATDITKRKQAEESLKITLVKIGENSAELDKASQEITAISSQMSNNSQQTADKANAVSSAAEQVSSNVANVATSSEEISSSVKEISMNAQNAAKVGNQAVEVSEQANLKIENLGNSSDEIGKVIKSITSIAQKTNLLALNAAIEAARAGEAGKGFAVVANEVKELARQTAAATEDISGKIEAIQQDTGDVVDSIAKIREIINQINDNQNTIASAVEEQTATVNEVARNASEASKGSNDIAKNISDVSKGADEASAGAKQTSSAAENLAQLAANLNLIVESAVDLE